MPAETEKQRLAAAIALHNPGKLYKRNRSMLKMSRGDLRDFASKRRQERMTMLMDKGGK